MFVIHWAPVFYKKLDDRESKFVHVNFVRYKFWFPIIYKQLSLSLSHANSKFYSVIILCVYMYVRNPIATITKPLFPPLNQTKDQWKENFRSSTENYFFIKIGKLYLMFFVYLLLITWININWLLRGRWVALNFEVREIWQWKASFCKISAACIVVSD